MYMTTGRPFIGHALENLKRFLVRCGLDYDAGVGYTAALVEDGEIIATGAYKPFDEHTAEIKRIWTNKTLRQQGLAARVVQELERRAVLAGYSRIYLTTGFRQPEAVRLYLSQGYQPQFDLNRDPEEYSQPPFDGRLRFTKTLIREALSKTA